MQRAPSTARDGQSRSGFTGILETFCESCNGAVAASLVDYEGEAVDLASVPEMWDSTDDAAQGGYTIKLIAAHIQIVLRHAAEPDKRMPVRQLWIHSERYGIVVKSLNEGYVLLLLCRPAALHTVSSRALRQVEVELALEAGWGVPEPTEPFWRRAMVRMDARRRPNMLRYAAGLDGSEEQTAEDWHRLRSHGPAEEVAGFERAYSVTIDDDLGPVSLVREPTGHWYVALDVLDHG